MPIGPSHVSMSRRSSIFSLPSVISLLHWLLTSDVTGSRPPEAGFHGRSTRRKQRWRGRGAAFFRGGEQVWRPSSGWPSSGGRRGEVAWRVAAGAGSSADGEAVARGVSLQLCSEAPAPAPAPASALTCPYRDELHTQTVAAGGGAARRLLWHRSRRRRGSVSTRRARPHMDTHMYGVIHTYPHKADTLWFCFILCPFFRPTDWLWSQFHINCNVRKMLTASKIRFSLTKITIYSEISTVIYFTLTSGEIPSSKFFWVYIFTLGYCFLPRWWNSSILAKSNRSRWFPF